jgi:GH25 family lysozyme M1 (1,4-beta-N-acetylmuramidase)
MQLIVNVTKLNKRSYVPVSLSENNIIGSVQQGFRFEGTEIPDLPNPALGKWYKDRDGSCYWGGGLTIMPEKIISNIEGLPVNLPSDYRIGIDISHHNDKPDWEGITEAGVSFVYIKISEGVGTPDHKAKEHADNAAKAGLRIGYYHFCRPDKRNGGTVINDSTAEADEALKIISGLQKPVLPLVLDLEDQANWDTPLDKTEYLLWAGNFIKRIQEKSGYDCMIYSRKEYLQRRLPGNHDLGKNRIWVSYYPARPDANHVLCPDGWDDWDMWQYTENGVIGQNPKMDINILKDSSLF